MEEKERGAKWLFYTWMCVLNEKIPILNNSLILKHFYNEGIYFIFQTHITFVCFDCSVAYSHILVRFLSTLPAYNVTMAFYMGLDMTSPY